jgi:hypothetical protein
MDIISGFICIPTKFNSEFLEYNTNMPCYFEGKYTNVLINPTNYRRQRELDFHLGSATE